MAQNNTSSTSAPRTDHDTTATIPNPSKQQQQPPSSAVQWESPAIFYENHSNVSHSSAPAHAQEIFPTEPANAPSVLEVPMCPDVSVEPIYRQHRSLSFSMGEEPGLFGYNEYYEEYEHSLDTMAEEDEAEDDEASRRTRSKSSGAALSRLSAAQQNHLQRMASTTMHSNANDDDNISTHHTTPSTHPHSPSSSSSAGGETAVSFSDPRANQEMGKGVPLHRLPPQAPLYMLEFKAGRTDFFYAPAGVHVQLGDLAIVEADRGKDIGKVAMLLASDQVLAMGIQKQQQQQQQQQQQEGATEMAPLTKADIHIKRIYRPASGDEIHLLLSKAQDEQKALAMCQQKTRQRKLPMEVVDAEYQWDRRKLTFYFVADRRIDFRELVRELFKIYKTRIWMCAVNSA